MEKKHFIKYQNKAIPASTSQLAPDFVGLSLRKVYQQARQMHIRLKIKGSGVVVRTIPAAGELLPSNHSMQVFMTD